MISKKLIPGWYEIINRFNWTVPIKRFWSEIEYRDSYQLFDDLFMNSLLEIGLEKIMKVIDNQEWSDKKKEEAKKEIFYRINNYYEV